MSKALRGDPSTPEYWNRRVKAIPDRKDMIFLDSRREDFWTRVREQLKQWRGLKVVDIACGYGQFAQFFSPKDYLGIDFSAEMLDIARKEFPDWVFLQQDLKTADIGIHDIIFEVNSLHSMGWTPEQFFDKFSQNARVAIACLEADQFAIKQLYT